ncbi:iron chaperone [Streptomyces antibioticus]|uniref:iron chaperone n=1 Tax=Streptomyces antibioticus TaxID=1890 RepID=UPI0036AD921D
MPSTKSPAEKYDGFTAEERAAMKEHAHEQKKAAARRGSSRAEKEAAAEPDVLAKIAEMPEADRVLAERVHEIVKTAAPGLAPKLWYGMPAYARDGKVVCHFQSAHKFGSRYATLGFSDQAALDEGTMWPTAYALKELTAADEQFISALVMKAAG